jgi:hypothetical protein
MVRRSMNYEHFLRRASCDPQTRTESIRRRPLRGGLALDTDSRRLAMPGAAQVAAVEERYRRSALACGDSVVNSVSDTLAMALGFVLARMLPAWSVVGLVVAIELVLGFMIRDNLTLNIVQLIHPSEAISHWQTRR